MAYVPFNLSVYVAAYAGAIAGMGASDRVPSSTVVSSYAGLSATAGAYAQAFDTAWGTVRANTLDLASIQEMTAGAWEGRAPVPNAQNFSPTIHVPLVVALIAAIKSSQAYVAHQGIVPSAPPVPGNVIIYQPGGQTSGSVFATWAEVQNVIAGVNAPLTIQADGTFSGAVITIPASSGTTVCRGLVTLSGNEANTQWTIEDGAQLLDLAGIDGGALANEGIVFTYTGNASVAPLAFTFPVAGTFFALRKASLVYGLSPNFAFEVPDGQTMNVAMVGAGLQAGQISVGAGSSTFLYASAADVNSASVIEDDSVTGGDGAARLFLTYDASVGGGGTGIAPLPAFPGFLGVITYAGAAQTALALPTDSVVTGTYTAKPCELVHVNPTGGSFNLTLPAISGIMPDGGVVIVKCTAVTGNTVTVHPASGTIDGVATFVLAPATKKAWAMFVAHVASNSWDVLFNQ